MASGRPESNRTHRTEYAEVRCACFLAAASLPLEMQFFFLIISLTTFHLSVLCLYPHSCPQPSMLSCVLHTT